jgi:hypothetical protein
MKKCIYIAGALSDSAVNYLYNVHKMMEVAESVRREGFSVYVPAIDLLMGIKFGYKYYEDYFNNSQPWLVKADGVFLVPGWKQSTGTKREIDLAYKNNIPVFEQLNSMIEYYDK